MSTMVPVTQSAQQVVQQPVQRAKVIGVQNQHPNHDLTQQKSAVQHQNQIKQWNHTGQATNPQAEERHLENKSSDWAPNNQISQQVPSNFQAGQEMFGEMQQQQGQVQSTQVPIGYASGQQLPQQTTQMAQISVAKPANQQQPGKLNIYY